MAALVRAAAVASVSARGQQRRLIAQAQAWAAASPGVDLRGDVVGCPSLDQVVKWFHVCVAAHLWEPVGRAHVHLLNMSQVVVSGHGGGGGSRGGWDGSAPVLVIFFDHVSCFHANIKAEHGEKVPPSSGDKSQGSDWSWRPRRLGGARTRGGTWIIPPRFTLW